MVTTNLIKSSNESIKSTLPAGLVAIFAGGTNGVGETTARQFARHALKPRAYIIGRSQEAGERITAECKAINPDGTFTFLKSDMSLMRNVDALCEDIANREKAINILCLTIGTLQNGIETAEGLHFISALTIHARSRMISNLLPLLRQGECLRRIVTVYGAGFEGQIHMEDFQSRTLGRMTEMAHLSSITTIDLLAHQKSAPEVSFIHSFPGAVESGIARGSIGPLMRVLKTVWAVLGPLVHIPLEEAGDRHLFLCTSARYPAAGDTTGAGVAMGAGLEVATGVDSIGGCGVYSVDEKGGNTGARAHRTIAGLVEHGMVETVRKRIRSDIEGALGLGVSQEG